MVGRLFGKGFSCHLGRRRLGGGPRCESAELVSEAPVPDSAKPKGGRDPAHASDRGLGVNGRDVLGDPLAEGDAGAVVVQAEAEEVDRRGEELDPHGAQELRQVVRRRLGRAPPLLEKAEILLGRLNEAPMVAQSRVVKRARLKSGTAAAGPLP
eukprot:CAMPEP_0172630542 /NCGR_PEP_ID=MMETSP1068-20121228/174189_1 /TAXON_ID=35684 /ORGANISM="Pseudopedinella elastica, Strain CCMP716" /LENGTH=153 /DNA_ID=CAMNT_0013441413 /DNA_START=242 /DNA_END=701 /DNA_ORIENTATION=+